MNGFVTDNGTTYYVDTYNHLIAGGKFKNPIRYINARVIIGMQGIFWLPNGQRIQTSIVRNYI